MASPPEKSTGFDVNDLEVSDKLATVHGQVIELSPLKKSKNRENCKIFSGENNRWNQGCKICLVSARFKTNY